MEKQNEVEDRAICQQLTRELYCVRLAKEKSRRGSFVKSWNHLLQKKRVQQIMRETLTLICKMFEKHPSFTADHKKASSWMGHGVRTSRGRSVANIIISDEKKFNLDGSDRLKYYWQNIKNWNCSVETSKKRRFCYDLKLLFLLRNYATWFTWMIFRALRTTLWRYRIVY